MAEKDSETEKPEAENEGEFDAVTPVWEWIVAGVGLLLVAGVVGFMFYEAVTEKSTPPEISVQTESIERVGENFLVTFTVKNGGETTAAALNIEGEIRRGTEKIETGTATLDYVPARSKRRGGIFFTQDPRQFELSLRASGYSSP